MKLTKSKLKQIIKEELSQMSPMSQEPEMLDQKLQMIAGIYQDPEINWRDRKKELIKDFTNSSADALELLYGSLPPKASVSLYP